MKLIIFFRFATTNLIAVSLFLWPTASFATGTKKLQVNCDLLGPTVKSKSVSDPTACQEFCTQEKCAAFTFVSGWNKCFLKRSARRPRTISIASGTLKNKRSTFEINVDIDNSGKDIKQVSAKSATACGQACQKFAACVAFAFISGYDSCWLKKTRGKEVAKKFYCGL